MAQPKTNVRFAGAVAIALIAAILSSCGSSQPVCMVIQNGMTLCGNKAAAWCRATDGLREEVGLTDPAVASTQRDCKMIEAKYQ